MAEFTSANNGKVYSAGMSIDDDHVSKTELCIEVTYWDKVLNLELYRQAWEKKDITSVTISEDKRKQFATYLRFVANMIDE